MVERTVIDDLNKAQARSRQVSQQGFYARHLSPNSPRRIDLRDQVVVTDAGQVAGQALQNLARFAGGALGDELNKAADKDEIEGRIAREQGKTLEQLQQVGANQYTERGWKNMDTVIAAQEWYEGKVAAIDGADAQLDPDAYRASLAEEFYGMRTGDEHTDALIMSLAEQNLPKLGAAQLTANLAYNKNKTITTAERLIYNMGTSDAGIDSVDNLLDFDNPPVDGLTREEHIKVAVSAAQNALAAGKPEIFLALRDKGFDGVSVAEQTTLLQSYEKWEAKQATQYNRDLTLETQAILTRAYEGNTSLNQSLADLEALQEKYDRGDGWIMAASSQVAAAVRAGRQMAVARNTAAASAAAEAEEAKRIADVSFQVQDVLMDVRDGAISREDAADVVHGIAVAAGIRDPIAFRNRQLPSIMSGHRGVIEDTRRAAIKAAEKEAKALEEAAEMTGILTDVQSFHDAAPKKQRVAVDALLGSIDEQVQELIQTEGLDPAAATDLSTGLKVEALATRDYVHEPTQRVLTAAFSTSPLNAEGEIKPGVLQALSMIKQFGDKHGKYGLALKYLSSPEAKAYATAVLDNLEAFPDPQDALTMAYEQNLGSPEQYEARKQAVVAEMAKPQNAAVLDAAVDNAVEQMTVSPTTVSGAGALVSSALSSVSTMFGFSDADDRSFQNWYYSDPANRSGAFEDVEFKAEVRRRAQQLRVGHPGLTAAQAAKMASSQLRDRSVVMAGKVLTAPEGTSILSRMGLEQFSQEPEVAHAALREFMLDNGPALWGDDWSERTKRVAGFLSSTFGNTKGGTALAPDAGGTMAKLYADFGDVDVRILDPQATTLVITPTMPELEFMDDPAAYVGGGVQNFLSWLSGTEAPDDIIMPSQVVTLAEIGAWYKAKREKARSQ